MGENKANPSVKKDKMLRHRAVTRGKRDRISDARRLETQMPQRHQRGTPQEISERGRPRPQTSA